MEDRELLLLKSLLTESRIATLAVTVDGSPFASLVPFALTPDAGTALIHASGLAQHSKGLGDGSPYSLLIHEADIQPESNPAQLARVTFTGSVQSIIRDSESYQKAKVMYLAKFPKSTITFQLGDFVLYALHVENTRFVAGFGKAFDLSLADLTAIS
jgi:putative heme iron utilization protein